MMTCSSLHDDREVERGIQICHDRYEVRFVRGPATLGKLSLWHTGDLLCAEFCLAQKEIPRQLRIPDVLTALVSTRSGT